MNNPIVQIKLFLNTVIKTHSRTVYGVIDLLGDLGGVLEVIMVFTGAIFLPLSEHHFILQAAKRMFIARTKDPTIFQDKSKGRCNTGNNNKILGKVNHDKLDCNICELELREELKSHYLARLSLKDSILLFIYNKLYWPPCTKCWFCWTWSKRSKLQRMYNETSDKLDSQLNIVKLLRQLRKVNILTK